MTEPSQGTGTETTNLVGQVLAGRYRILEKLGEGAMGAVYLGEHVRMGRKDAIKVLRSPLAADPEAVRRFNRGARNVSAVHHPNVCTIYDFSDTAEGVTFLAMELIQGESLKELLEREKLLPPERAVVIGKQVADALQAAHDAGIVHRDLKPGNIMLTRDRRGAEVVKVVDFDIAKGQEEVEGSEVTRVGFVVGTPEYMSPEQLMGEKLDGRSDLYSLGLVLFRMLTGSLPFRAASQQELMVQRLTHAPLHLEEVAPGRNFPPGLQTAIDRALARVPAGRQESAGEFGREIVGALAAAAPAAAPVGVADVAPTVVAPAGSTGPGTGGTPAMAPPVAAHGTEADKPVAFGSRPGNRPVVLAGGLLVILAAVGGGLALWVRGHRAPSAANQVASAPAGATTTPAVPPVTGPAAPASGSTAPGTTSPAGGSTVPATASPADGGGSAGGGTATPATASRATPSGPVVQRPPVRPPAASAAGGAGRGGYEPPRELAASLTVANANTTLWRQLDRLGPPAPTRAQLLAIRDTAAAYWNLPGVGNQDRARAAYIVASTFIAVDADSSRIIMWLQRAVSLDPNNPGYRRQLGSYQGQAQ